MKILNEEKTMDVEKMMDWVNSKGYLIAAGWCAARGVDYLSEGKIFIGAIGILLSIAGAAVSLIEEEDEANESH